MTERPAVTVVVVTYRSADVVAECLDALPAALAGCGSYAVVVADNASDDGTREAVAARCPAAEIVALAENRGYAAGINAGLARRPPAQAALVLNPDVRLAPGSVRRLLDGLADASVGVAAPRLVDEDGRTHPSLRREPTIRRALGEALLGGARAALVPALGEVVTGRRRYQRPGEFVWATGAALLISRRCLDTVGAWDESYFLYSEETDYLLRARDAGLRLRFVPAATATHLGGAAMTDPRLYSLLTANRADLFQRRHDLPRALAFRAALLLGEAVRAAFGRPTARAAAKALLQSPRRVRARVRAELSAGSRSRGWVCFAGQDWWYHNRAHSDFQLMRRVARDQPVLVVNSIGLRMPLPGRSTQPLRRVLRKIASIAKGCRRPLPELPGFIVMSPVVLPFYGQRWLRPINALVIRWQVNRSMRAAGMVEPTVLVTLPTAWEVARKMKAGLLLFNRVDRHSEFGEADRAYLQGLEQQLLENADGVLYVSRTLLAEEAGVVGDRAHFLDHGVDLEHFAPIPRPEPAELTGVPRPRVGFFGGIHDYVLDIKLLEHVAHEILTAQLVLVGDATCSLAGLLGLPNVHWLGKQPYEQIPRVGAAFDVAIMPWLDNAWIRACNPIKVKEYLALGLPVVSTYYPEVERYAHVVQVARDPDEFVAHIRAALAGRSPGSVAERRAAVADSSWEGRAADLLAWSAQVRRNRS